MEPVAFWFGVLACGLVAQAGELLNDRIERSLRVRAARRRASRVCDGAQVWASSWPVRKGQF